MQTESQQYRVLVTQEMNPIPSGILIIKDYGDIKSHDGCISVSGRNLLLKGGPEIFVRWLKSFDEVWVSESEDPLDPFTAASIKNKLR